MPDEELPETCCPTGLRVRETGQHRPGPLARGMGTYCEREDASEPRLMLPGGFRPPIWRPP